MKSQYILSKVASRLGGIAFMAAGLMLFAGKASAGAKPEVPEILPPSSLPYGYSYEEWSAKWWQWSLGQSTKHIELVGSPDICTGPASRVRFLNGVYLPVTGGATIETNHVTIDANTPLFFTVLSVWVDNSGCPFTSNSVADLYSEAAGEWGAVTQTSCTIDGQAIAGLDDPASTEYLTISPPFSYTTAEKDNVLAEYFGSPCIEGDTTIYPAVAQGVYLMVAPLKPGKHTIEFTGIVAAGGSIIIDEEITYIVEVL
jgi:hypothetical protein